MPQSLCQIYLHVVFSTKNRLPLLQNAELRNELHRYLGGACRQQDSPPLQIGGVEDHVHLLLRLSKTLAVADLVRELKRESSKWIKQRSSDAVLRDFHWQAGYGSFSISPSHVEAVGQYIRDQEQHHRRESFQDEFRRMCQKYGIEIDERYVWD
jgi:putative transposase